MSEKIASKKSSLNSASMKNLSAEEQEELKKKTISDFLQKADEVDELINKAQKRALLYFTSGEQQKEFQNKLIEMYA